MNDYLTTYELYHHHLKDRKWRLFHYQNEEGILTKALPESMKVRR